MLEGGTDRPWREEDILAFEKPLPLPERHPGRRADSAPRRLRRRKRGSAAGCRCRYNEKMTPPRFRNTLYTQDCLYVLNGTNSETVDLIYLDPPFNSKRMYSAPMGSKAAGASFKDMWTWKDVDEAYLERMVDEYPHLVRFLAAAGAIHGKPMMSYLTYMTQRIVEMRRVLKPTGSIYLHCDPTASHYLKVVMDRIFGKSNFRNEIIWCYTGPGNTKKRFPRKHDTILYYVKSGANSVFDIDAIRIPYKAEFTPARGVHGRDYDRTRATARHDMGKVPEDWWADGHLSNVSAWRKELVGYPTQKPLALLRRIVQASSSKGDIVLDPFCGCATTMVAAQRLGRKWIGIDVEEKAADLVVQRLSDDAGLFKDFVHLTEAPVRTDVRQVDLRDEKNKKKIKERLGKEFGRFCAACGMDNFWNLDVDHIVPKAKGGGDYYENYQLLCGNCNSVKGDRPMEYLMAKIAQRDRLLKNEITFGGRSG